MRGDVTDGVLTCAWHNWKFELGTGTCRYGGENIRTYPVQIRDGQVFIDIADPPTEIIRPDLFRSLTAAMDDLDISRLARDAMRLQRIGTPLADVVREGVRYAAPRAEHGWDYSLATRADCLRMSQFFDESLEALFRGADHGRGLTDGSPQDEAGALVQALEAGAPVTAVIDATGRAASERLARFDIELDLDDTNDWGWLDVTHTLTYLNALRWAWSADPSSQVLRGLFHAAWSSRLPPAQTAVRTAPATGTAAPRAGREGR